jgi:hypothetical protein
VDHTNEIARFRSLLERLDLTDAVIPADALHTQREHADWLVTHKHADYLLLVKANQPTLHRQLQHPPWPQVPVADHTHNRGHGRVEVRRLQVTTIAGLDFPHATRALWITRRVRPLHGRRWRTVVVYAIASLTTAQARPAAWPTTSAATGHRGAAPPPRAMASLRNLAVGILRAHGDRNTAALRHYARDANRVLPLLGITSP